MRSQTANQKNYVIPLSQSSRGDLPLAKEPKGSGYEINNMAISFPEPVFIGQHQNSVWPPLIKRMGLEMRLPVWLS